MTAATLAATALLVLSSPALGQSSQSRSNTAIPDRAVLLQQAADAKQAGRQADALRLLRLAGERYQSVQAYLELARLQLTAGDSSAALDSLSKARGIAPNSEDVLSAYAQLALSMKQPLPAVLTLQSLTRLYPTVPRYHYLLGVGLMVIGDMPAAAESLAEANRLEPDRAFTLLAFGMALNNRKLFADAKAALMRSLELEPESIEAVAALAEAEAGLGDLDSAAAHAKQALDRSPDSATANLVLGLIFMERREYSAARDRLLKALESDPDSPKAAYQLSLAFARLGDDVKAKEYVELYREKMRGFEDKLRILRSGGGDQR